VTTVPPLLERRQNRPAAGSAVRERSAVISPPMGKDTTLADRGSLRSQRMVLYRIVGA